MSTGWSDRATVFGRWARVSASLAIFGASKEKNALGELHPEFVAGGHTADGTHSGREKEFEFVQWSRPKAACRNLFGGVLILGPKSLVLSFCNRRRLAAFCAVVALLCSSALWSQPAPPQPGPYRVLTIERTVLHDPARDKDILIKVYYPDGRGPFPVIIFSHGALASKDAYFTLGQFWASHGYVCIHPSHSDSIADYGFRGTLRQAISDPQGWENRPKDISFILDSLPRVRSFAPQLAGKLDLRHIGVGGHSFGAYTASLTGGAAILLPGKDRPRSFLDRRVSAIVMLSPQGEGIMGLTPNSWDELRLPMLLMFGSRDFGPFDQPAKWRSEPFAKAPPTGNKYEVEIVGAKHMDFTGPAACGEATDEVFQTVEQETLAFWNAYLKQDRQALQYLTSQRLQRAGGQADRFLSK